MSDTLRIIAESTQHLLQRFDSLLAELEELRAVITERNDKFTWYNSITGFQKHVLLNVVKNRRAVAGLQKECESIDPSNEEAITQLKTKLGTPNIEHFEALWDLAKKCRNVRAFAVSVAGRHPVAGPYKAAIDVVHENGAEWVKLAHMAQKRSLYQMAAEGWDWDDEDEDEESDNGDKNGQNGTAYAWMTDDSKIEAFQQARQAVLAALDVPKATRPRIRLVLPRTNEGEVGPIDQLLGRIRNMGRGEVEVIVECANSPGATLLRKPTPPLREAIATMVPEDMYADFTSTLSLDCSILFALASDIGHRELSSIRRKANILSDTQDERRNGPRLVKSIYPVLGARKLICTREVADTFLTIVMDIGTEMEQERTRLFLAEEALDEDEGEDEEAQRSWAESRRRKLLAAFQQLSIHPVPEDLQLPVQIVPGVKREDVPELVAKAELHPLATVVARDLNPVNLSSFLHGMRSGFMTVTSNSAAVNHMCERIEKAGGARSVVGPPMWVTGFGRRLAARPRPGEILDMEQQAEGSSRVDENADTGEAAMAKLTMD